MQDGRRKLIAMTLIDVLSGLDHVQICTAYKYRGQRLETFRADMDTLAEVEPIYETLPGWRGNISGCRRFEDLPRDALQMHYELVLPAKGEH